MFVDLLRSETATSPARRHAALAGLRAYQQALRLLGRPPVPVVSTVGRARLLDYGAKGGAGMPLVVVPSLINAPWVLDLSEHNSLLRWLATQGFRPLLVDWDSPSAAEHGLSIAGHVETLLVPLIDSIGERPVMAGYCLGGTMAAAAAALRRPRALALIATPWRFSGFPRSALDDLTGLWEQVEPGARRLGLMPMEVLQTSFWRLDPARTVSKFERFSRLDPMSEAAQGFIAVEDWANDGPPLTYAAARELMIDLFCEDRSGRGVWQVGGKKVDVSALGCPVLDISSTSDRIVPATSAAGIGDPISLGLGHVGMVVGGRARALMWEPLARWMHGALGTLLPGR